MSKISKKQEIEETTKPKLSRAAINRILFSNKMTKKEDEHLSTLPIYGKRKSWVIKLSFDLQEKHTKQEGFVFGFLYDLKINFVFQAPFVFDDKIYFADFFLLEKNIILEIDGGYHDTNEQKKSDKKRDKDFKNHGIKTIRIKNDIAMNYDKLRKIFTKAKIL